MVGTAPNPAAELGQGGRMFEVFGENFFYLIDSLVGDTFMTFAEEFIFRRGEGVGKDFLDSGGKPEAMAGGGNGRGEELFGQAFDLGTQDLSAAVTRATAPI